MVKLVGWLDGWLVGWLAGLAFKFVFENFEKCYNLLANLLDDLEFVSGIDLDFEEQVELDQVVQLVQRLKTDFDIQVSVCCVAHLLMPYQPRVFAGFCYADLIDQVGDLVDVFNTRLLAWMYTPTSAYQCLPVHVPVTYIQPGANRTDRKCENQDLLET
jgi:hypothetical protein